MTSLKRLLLALNRIATALEQLTPALTQATREANQTRLTPPVYKRGRHEDIDRIEIEAMKAGLRAMPSTHANRVAWAQAAERARIETTDD